MHSLLKAWHFMVLFQVIACYSAFTIGGTELPRTLETGVIGYDNKTNSILLFGGWISDRQFIRFQNNQFIDEGQTYLSSSQAMGFAGQQYTQINNVLWTTTYSGDYLYAINTHTYFADAPSITIPTSPQYRGCLASYMHYIFVVGGGDGTTTLDLVQIYDILDTIWITNTPNMNQARRSFSCLVSGSQLFAIGGYDGSNCLDSIEALTVSDINNINSHKWNYLSGTLSEPSCSSRAVSYDGNILVIGELDFTFSVVYNTVHIIDTMTGSCSLWDTLLTARANAPCIIVHNTLFVFSGVISLGPDTATKTYEYKLLSTPQPTTAAPSPAPTVRPTTPRPTTAAPSPVPTVRPTTPSPTQPPPLPCGGETVGHYSGGQLVFETTMPFTGDIIFDASNSNFGIAEIQALTALGTSLGSDSDGDGVVTLSQAIASDYKFVMVGEATGVYHVKIQCVSDSPTKDPTTPPVNHPITAHPTRRPSLGPFVSPVTSEPTTAMPTVLPSKRPTPLVTTKRPIATVADTTEDSNDNDEREDEVQGEAEPSDVRIAVYILCGLIICCVCLCGLFVYKHCLGVMIRKKTGDRGMGRPQAEIDCERNLVMQWLRHTVKLPQYMDKFVTNGYDNMRAIQLINSKEELARCGIEMPGHQTLILAEIYKARGLVSSNVVNKPMIEMREMGRGLENGEVNGEGVLIGHATRESLSDSRFDATFVHATVTHGTDEVPPAANAPLVLDIPQPPQDPEDAMTVEGRT